MNDGTIYYNVNSSRCYVWNRMILNRAQNMKAWQKMINDLEKGMDGTI